MIVIKYGGHALPEPGGSDEILRTIAREHLAGRKIVLVHGGGPQINSELAVHNLPAHMVGGYRFTTPEVFEVVQKVLSGQVLRTLVNQLIGFGCNAIGISSGDGETIRAKKVAPILVEDELQDLGLVGEVLTSNSTLLNLLLSSGFLPVVSPVAVDNSGQGLNLNADLATGAIGGALKADEVIFMTDVAGIYRHYPDPDSVIREISATDLVVLQESFVAGMIPKSQAAISALAAGAKKVRIIDGREPSNLAAALNGLGGTVVFA